MGVHAEGSCKPYAYDGAEVCSLPHTYHELDDGFPVAKIAKGGSAAG